MNEIEKTNVENVEISGLRNWIENAKSTEMWNEEGLKRMQKEYLLRTGRGSYSFSKDSEVVPCLDIPKALTEA